MPTIKNLQTGVETTVTDKIAADRLRYPAKFELVTGDAEPAAAAPGATPAGRDPGTSPGNPGPDGSTRDQGAGASRDARDYGATDGPVNPDDFDAETARKHFGSMGKDELVTLADERGLTVTRADGKDGDPLVSDYVTALATPRTA